MSRKRQSLKVYLTVAVASLTLGSFVVNSNQTDTIIKGKLIEIHCFVSDSSRHAESPKQCALVCFRRYELPLILMNKDGTYVLVEDDATTIMSLRSLYGPMVE